MAKFEVGDKVIYVGKVLSIELELRDHLVLVEHCGRSLWLHEESLTRVPAPVMVKCDTCGVERPLTDFKTLKDRAKALGMKCSDWNFLGRAFVDVCAELAEKGVTAEQFVAGLET